MPLNTRDGNADEPIEPVIWNIDPCDFGPPPKWCRFTTPWKPLPLLTPTMSTNFSPSKISTSTRSPTFTAPLPSAAVPSLSSGTSRRNFTGGRLFFARCPRSGFESRDSFTNSTRPICADSYPCFTAVLCCVMTQGPACSTVAGRTSPFESNSCVMPTFFPRIPATFAISFSIPSVASGYWLGSTSRSCVLGPPTANDQRLFMFLPEGLDLHVHTRRQVQLHQGIDGLLRGFEDVEQALVRPDLESLAGLFVHVRRTQHAVFVLHRGQRNRSRDLRARAPGSFDDLTRGLVQDAVVVGFQPDANSLFSNHVSLANPSRPAFSRSPGRKERAASCRPLLMVWRGRPRPRLLLANLLRSSAPPGRRGRLPRRVTE